MESPTERSVTAYAPVPPPPISSSGNRPFLRSALAFAEPCGAGGSFTPTPRSTRDGPSPSWVSLNDSLDNLGSLTQSPQLSAPHSQSLEVAVQPPPMPRALCPSPPSALSLSPLGAPSPAPSASFRDGALSRSALTALKLAAGHRVVSTAGSTAATSAVQKRCQAPSLVSCTSPLIGVQRESVLKPSFLATKTAAAGSRRRDSTTSVGGGTAAFARSGSLPTSGELIAPPSAEGAPFTSLRGAATGGVAASCSLVPDLTAKPSLLREDRQPALPQRVFQTPLSLFVDCAVSMRSHSPTLYDTPRSGSDLRTSSSTDVSSSRMWGYQRGARAASASPPTSAPLSSSDLTTVTGGCGERQLTASRTGLTPAPPLLLAAPPPPPPPSSAAVAGAAVPASVSNAPTACLPRRHRRATISPAGPSLPLPHLRGGK